MGETPRERLRHKRTLPDGSPAPLRGIVRCGWAGDDVSLSTGSAEIGRELAEKVKAWRAGGDPLPEGIERLEAALLARDPDAFK